MSDNMDAVNTETLGKSLPLHSRGYQLEMLEASIHRNVVVAMDTGSGKTQIALLRICAEVDRLCSEKLIWFLAPSVALCTQQHTVIASQIPAVRTRLLLGSDNVDRWSEQSIWDIVLSRLQVVVSTHAILSDALSHGFIKMQRLALMIFDEAHHCTGNHPANQIMRDFYHPEKSKSGPESVPRILGLTASPIVRSKLTDMRLIEGNLDSVIITPRVNRQELLEFVHRPALEAVNFESKMTNMSNALTALKLTVQENDLQETSHSLKLAHEAKELRKKTQLGKFLDKAEHIQGELGPWATDYFVGESINTFKMAMREGGEKLYGLKNMEKDRIMNFLSLTTISRSLASHTEERFPRTSAKFECLVSVLRRVYSPGFCGLVFVNQRATVVALSQLLSAHPDTGTLFRCRTFVGMSSNACKKTELGDLLDHRVQQTTLDAFREGDVNLIIATNALEEGIDVSACNTVICFDEPPNLKSFIQRRGRARKEKSNFFVLLGSDSNAAGVRRWRELEREMTEAYQRDRKIADDASTMENVREEVYGNFLVESTGALLTMGSALAHLNHFCASLPKHPYVTLQPVFAFRETEVAHQIRAEVFLPNCIDPALRQTRGIRGWHSERMATKDAAFQAYVRLHQAGLVNDQLLPFHSEVLEAFERRPPSILVPDQYNPWIEIARSWTTPHKIYRKVVVVHRPGLSTFEIALMLPVPTRPLPEFPLFVDAGDPYFVSLRGQYRDEIIPLNDLSVCRSITDLILRSVHSESMTGNGKDFVVPFMPFLRDGDLQGWLDNCCGTRPASAIDFSMDPWPGIGLLHDMLKLNNAFVPCHQYDISKDVTHYPWACDYRDQTTIPATPLTSRRNFLHRGTQWRSPVTDNDSAPYSRNAEQIDLPKDRCIVDCLPFDFTQFALLAPSILYRVEIGLVADQLCMRMLPSVRFSQLDLVIDSICATSIHLQTNHELLEFLGSSVLKFIVARQLFVNHTNWHEGCLSKHKDLIVSNTRLVEAALKAGLEDFIITRNLNGHAWKPLYISEIESNRPTGERLMPVKLLASTVKALIGAAFLDGDFSNAVNCARFFLPEIKEWSWTALFDGTYLMSRPKRNDFPPYLTSLESLTGYLFHDKSLLVEALTHPSCDWSTWTCTYQRLALLGDAVLEVVVTDYLSRETWSLSRDMMHLCKVASTNAKFLAWICMDSSTDMEIDEVAEISDGNPHSAHSQRTIHPWMFLRYSGVAITKGRDESLERHARLHQSIRSALSNTVRYPWQELTRLNADSFFSDIVQSLFGAVYMDSKGDLTQCKSLAENMGVLTHLRHFSGHKIDLCHPKSRLGELASGERIVYIHGSDTDGLKADWCVVEIDGHEVARAEGNYSKECMEIIAAEIAIEKRRIKSEKLERSGEERFSTNGETLSQE